MQLYKAQYIYPISSPPIIDGIIVIDGECIAAVGPTAAITQQYSGTEVTGLGQVMLMPQAVNAHTHLELTMLAEMGKQYIADRSFCQWIVKLVKVWRTIPASVQVEGAQDGCRMLIEKCG